MEIDDRAEATMHDVALTDSTTPRYGYQPGVMFAATRAFAERRAHREAADGSPNEALPLRARTSLHRFVSWLTGVRS